MLPSPYRLETLIAERREDLLRAAEQDRLARLGAPRAEPAPRPGPRARLAGALRSLADRLAPAAAGACDVGRGPVAPRWQESVR